MLDRAGLADFLRRRRDALQPEDVGIPRGPRRRTAGLRREEVASLCHVSVDYYSRLERQCGPHPSDRLIASIAQGMHLSPGERDHLFRLAGHAPPARPSTAAQISAGMLRIFEQFADSPAEVVTELGETLRQTPLAVALHGDAGQRAGPMRSVGYRWFTDPAWRSRYHPDDHEHLSRYFTAAARKVVTLRGPGSRAAALADRLRDQSAEFAALWEEHDVGVRYDHPKRFVHPVYGVIELSCEKVLDPEQSHVLLVYTAVPGSASHRSLQCLSADLLGAVT
jgi:hypothetical protein